jgi:hypothetical protein
MMGLNSIDLPAAMVANIYGSALVETGEIAPPESPEKPVVNERPVTTPTVETKAPAPETKSPLRSLGENRKNVLILVDAADAVFLGDKDLELLTSILAACKLGLADVAIVNKYQHTINYKELVGTFSSKVCLLFAIPPSAIDLPVDFPAYQVQPFAGCSFLYGPSLAEMQSNQELKKKLWISLKRLFNL